MSKNWKESGFDPDLAGELAEATGLPVPLAAVLIGRGYTDARAVDHFLNPRLSDLCDPFLLPDMEKAVDRIRRAVESREPIVVFGDYDADGITATALLIRVLKKLGAAVTPFLPHRIEDGYGLAADTLQKCMDEAHPQLVITVDCGTGSVEAVERARAGGVDVVVTDHHEPTGANAPAVAVVNPKRGAEKAMAGLAGVGVAFKLCHALLKRGREKGAQSDKDTDLRQYLDLVGIGTIADVVPLVDENRILARHGLARLNKTESVGLRSLIEISGLKSDLDTYHVGYMIGPRLNAAGRIGDAVASLRLLLTEDAGEAQRLARQLDSANRERQDIEKQIVLEAMAEIDGFFNPKQHFGLVVARKDWHPGVVGIVASRLSAKYRRPAVVIALDETGMGRGSCRSIERFDMLKGLEACEGHLVRFGGHTMAAGLDIQASAVEAFKAEFNRVAAKELKGVDLRAVQNIDAWVELGELDDVFQDALDRMRPFGLGNPTPTFAVRGVKIVGQPRILKDAHLKMPVASGGVQREAIAFNMADREIPAGPVDIAFHSQRNEYMGRVTLQLNVQDFRPTPPSGGS